MMLLDVTIHWSQILIFSLIGVLVLLSIGIFLSLFFKSNIEKKTFRKGSSTLSITVNLKDDSVLIFSKKRLNGIRKLSLSEYYHFFDVKSKQKIEETFEKIRLNLNEEYNSTIELNSFHSDKKRKLLFSVLHINSINRSENLIHATQYFFTGIPCIEGVDLKKENKIKSQFNVAENNLKIRIKNIKSSKGAACLFRYSVSSLLKNEDVSVFIYYTLIEIISRYVNQHKALVRGKHTDLILYDFKVSKRKNIYRTLTEIKKKFIKIMEMSNILNRMSFNISVAEFKFYPRDYQKIIKALHQAANEATIKKKEILFYDNQTREEYFFDQSYKNEVSTIIQNNSFKYSFSPIVSTKSFDIIGYISKTTPISNVFSDINEVKDYAYKLSYSRDLFSEVTKHLLSKFANETNERVRELFLFYNLTYHELPYANSLLGFMISAKKVNIVLTFNEGEMLKNIEKDSNYFEGFKKLSSKGYKIALEVTLKTLELPDAFYNLFDYFIFSRTYYETNFDDISHSSLSMKKAIEKILRFGKKVIVTDLNNWNDVEIRIQENIKLLSGSAISPQSEMLLPIEKKIMDKIKKTKKRG